MQSSDSRESLDIHGHSIDTLPTMKKLQTSTLFKNPNIPNTGIDVKKDFKEFVENEKDKVEM